MFQEDPLHAVQCTTSDQSQNALRALTKLDDGVLLGSENDLIRSWNPLSKLGPDRGLHFRVDKCELCSKVDSET